jgi:hypothetical protein
MVFTLDFWEETVSYRLGWQAGDGRKASLPARFIRVLTCNLLTYSLSLVLWMRHRLGLWKLLMKMLLLLTFIYKWMLM